MFSLNTPPPGNQGSKGACAAFASAYSMFGYFMGNGSNSVDYAKVGSPEFIYSQCKTSPDCLTGGCSFISQNGNKGVLDLLKETGVCPWSDMPYNEASCTGLPNTAQIDAASKYKLKSYSRLAQLDETNVKTILYSGKPILIGMFVDNSFLKADKNFIWKSQGDTIKGGHAMVIMGYDDTKSAYKILNQWGSGWGDNGYGWIDYKYLEKSVKEAYILESDIQNTPVNNPVSSCSSGHWGSVLFINNSSNYNPVKIYINSKSLNGTATPDLVLSPNQSGMKTRLPANTSYTYEVWRDRIPNVIQKADTKTIIECKEHSDTIYIDQ